VDGVDLNLALLKLEFGRLVKQTRRPDLHFRLVGNGDGRVFVQMNESVFDLTQTIRDVGESPKDCLNAIVEIELTKLGRADLLSEWSPVT
jgi:hypothetical protein